MSCFVVSVFIIHTFLCQCQKQIQMANRLTVCGKEASATSLRYVLQLRHDFVTNLSEFFSSVFHLPSCHSGQNWKTDFQTGIRHGDCGFRVGTEKMSHFISSARNDRWKWNTPFFSSDPGYWWIYEGNRESAWQGKGLPDVPGGIPPVSVHGFWKLNYNSVFTANLRACQYKKIAWLWFTAVSAKFFPIPILAAIKPESSRIL